MNGKPVCPLPGVRCPRGQGVEAGSENTGSGSDSWSAAYLAMRSRANLVTLQGSGSAFAKRANTGKKGNNAGWRQALCKAWTGCAQGSGLESLAEKMWLVIMFLPYRSVMGTTGCTRHVGRTFSTHLLFYPKLGRRCSYWQLSRSLMILAIEISLKFLLMHLKTIWLSLPAQH